MPWPRLTETLDGLRDPQYCQSCSRAKADLIRWQECSESDRKEYRVVVLCKACSGRLIEPHPRLYHELSANEPWPGCMPICVDCVHRDGVLCTSPQAQVNGGPGLKYQPEGQYVHLCRSPRRLSGWHWIGEPVAECSGKGA